MRLTLRFVFLIVFIHLLMPLVQVNSQGDLQNFELPQWSPDGTYFSYIRGGYTSPRQLVIALADNVAEATVLVDNFTIEKYYWSPDSQQIAFDDNGQVTVARLDDTELVLPDNYAAVPCISWSPDSSAIAFSVRNGLAIVDSASGEEILHYETRARAVACPRWLPHSNSIYYMDNTLELSLFQDIFVMDVDTREETPFIALYPALAAAFDAARNTNNRAESVLMGWSPTGAQFAYRLYDVEDWGVYDVCTIKADGSDQYCVPRTLNAMGFAWSSDGSYFAVGGEHDCGENLLLVNTATKNIFPVALTSNLMTSLVDQNGELTWSPDGGKIAFDYFDVGNSILTIDVLTGQIDVLLGEPGFQTLAIVGGASDTAFTRFAMRVDEQPGLLTFEYPDTWQAKIQDEPASVRLCEIATVDFSGTSRVNSIEVIPGEEAIEDRFDKYRFTLEGGLTVALQSLLQARGYDISVEVIGNTEFAYISDIGFGLALVDGLPVAIIQNYTPIDAYNESKMFAMRHILSSMRYIDTVP